MIKSVTDSRLMHGPDGAATGAGVWRVVLLYAGFATAWVLFSDLLLSALFSDPRDIERASIAKGWLFVLVTALLLLVHLSRHAARIERRDAQLRAITLQAGDAIGVVDAAMRLQFVNPAACELTGYTHGELIGKSLPDLMPADARDAIAGYLPGLIEGVVRRDEWPLIRKDGRRLRVDVTAQRLADGRYLGIVRDITERKRVESLVENERLRMQTLIRSLPDMVWLKDPQGVFLLCNPAFEACSGVGEAGILGKTDYDLVSAEKADEFRESDLRALSSDRPVSFEQWVDSAGRGRRMLMQVTKSRVFDAEGKVIGVLGVGRDVTEDREARRVLRDRLELQAMLANIAASAPGVIFSFRLQPDGRAQMPYASPKIEQVTGITAQALARDVAPLWALLHPEDVARLDRSVRDSAQSMGAWEEEFRVRHPALGERWVAGHATPEREADGSVLWRGFLSDVTERKHSEQAVRESETRYRHLFAGMQNGMVHCRMVYADGVACDFVYLDFNPAFERITGLKGIAGKAASEIDPALLEGNPGLLDVFSRVATTGVGESVEAYVADRGRWLSISAYCPARGEFVALLYDVTARKQAETRASEFVDQLQKSVTSTVEVVSRMLELRDPYTAGHESRVADLAVAIAGELGLDEYEQTGMRVAGNLHDIGKIAVPSEILTKPGRLSALEYEVVKTHVAQGYDVLRRVEFSWPVAEAVLQHHERLDGSGYPNGLKGPQISRQGRILAVADVVEAMASHRPYRPGLGVEAALAEINSGAGRLFDAEVVGACNRLFRDKGYSLPGPG